MKRTLLHYLAAIVFATSVGGTIFSVATPMTASAATINCEKRLLTFPAWYRGLTKVEAGECVMKSPEEFNSGSGVKESGISTYIWKIVLNIIEIALQLIGYMTVGFIIFGGYRYMTSAGSPDGMVKARKTITNAIIGLILSILSVGIVNLVAGALS